MGLDGNPIGNLAKSDISYLLASTSPRRRELLASLGISFSVVAPNYDENLTKDSDPDQHALTNACEKGRWVTRSLPRAKPTQSIMVIAADTIVSVGNEILNKPTSLEDSRRMLVMLSGREHEVKTAIAVFYLPAGKTDWIEQSDVVTTKVKFRNLGTGEIERYIATGEPADKAGSYGIQGLAGAFVEKITGSYSNVVGLPLAELRCRIESLVTHL